MEGQKKILWISNFYLKGGVPLHINETNIMLTNSG